MPLVKQKGKKNNQSQTVKKGNKEQSANESEKTLENQLELEFKMQFDLIAQKMAEEC